MNLINKIQLIINKKNKLSLFFLIFLMITVMLLEILSLGLIAPSLTVIIDPTSINKYLDNQIINFIIYNKEKAALLLLSSLILIFLFKTLLVFFLNWNKHKIWSKF